MTAAAIFVCGLGRCGTSLVMQMLDAGGVPVLVKWPGYECPESMLLPRGSDWLREHAPGRAVKILDPHRWTPPRDMPALVIWLDRDIRQQAQSQIKFSELLHGKQPDYSRAARRAITSILLRDRPRALAAIGGQDRKRLTCDFERLVEDPVRAAAGFANFLALHGGPTMRASSAAAAAIPRSGACYAGFLELEVLDRGRKVA